MPTGRVAITRQAGYPLADRMEKVVGIGERFKTFCERLTIDNRSDVSARYKAITKRLNKDFWGSESETDNSFYTGSYGRGTAARGCSDIDVIMALPSDVYYQYDKHKNNGQSALLQAVRDSILKTYSSTAVGADGQVVAVSFTGGMVFEIVPAFACDDGTYTFPNSNGGGAWRSTNPKPEIKAIGDLNTLTKGNMVNLARMVRKWRDANGVNLGGLLVDTLCYNFLSDWTSKDKGYLYYDFMTRDFFEFLAKEDDNKAYWLAPGSRQQANRKGPFSRAAKTAQNHAITAIAHDNKGEEWSANKEWGAIYGSFP